MSNKIFISKHMQIDNNHHSIDNSEKQSNNSLHIRQTSYNPPQNVDVMFNQVNLQYHHKLADPLKVKCRDSWNRSMSNSKLKSKKKSKFSNIKISSIKLSDQSNINDTSALNNSISSSTNTKSRKANIEMKMKINQMIDQTWNFHKKVSLLISFNITWLKVLSIDGYSSKSPHIVIPQGKIQIKQQYLNSSLINSKIGHKPKNSS